MIGKSIKVENFSGVGRLATYLVNPNAKHDAAEKGERLLLCETSGCIPFAHGSDPIIFGERFAKKLEEFTIKARAGKKMPQSPCQHLKFNFHPDDPVDPELAMKISNEVLDNVMPGERIKMLTTHGDTAHLHVHSAVSSVDSTGKIWNPRFDFRLWEAEMEKMEIKYGLKRVEVRISEGRHPDVKAPTTNELQRERRTGIKSSKQILQDQIGQVLDAKVSFKEFSISMEQLDIGVNFNISKTTGKVTGVSFDYDGEVFKGSQLGKKFGWGSVSKLTNYDQEIHKEEIDIWQSRQVAPPTLESKFKTPVIQPNDIKNNALRSYYRPKYSEGTPNKTEYCYQKSSKIAFTDIGNKIESNRQTTSKSQAMAMAQLAIEKGWKSVKVTGTGINAQRIRDAAIAVGLKITTNDLQSKFTAKLKKSKPKPKPVPEPESESNFYTEKQISPAERAGLLKKEIENKKAEIRKRHEQDNNLSI